MKREDITALLPEITKEQLDKIMDLHGRDIQGQSKTITTLTAERDGLKTQLANATTEIQSYKDMDIDGIKTKAAEWETKYNTDTAALRQQLEDQQYGYAVESVAGGLKFSSASAKKAFLSDLTAKKLTLEDGKLLGFEDYVKTYKEQDPGAFAPEGAPPRVVAGTSGGTGGKDALSAIAKAMGIPDKKD